MEHVSYKMNINGSFVNTVKDFFHSIFWVDISSIVETVILQFLNVFEIYSNILLQN